MKFTVEKIGNMVYLSSEDVIFKAWMADEFTERKLTNAVKKISADLNGNMTVERKF